LQPVPAEGARRLGGHGDPARTRFGECCSVVGEFGVEDQIRGVCHGGFPFVDGVWRACGMGGSWGELVGGDCGWDPGIRGAPSGLRVGGLLAAFDMGCAVAPRRACMPNFGSLDTVEYQQQFAFPHAKR